ncbi:ATP-dependent Clp protease ATP-binding subunit ClpA [Kitasatospora sp. MAP12-15]|uniref:Clp protease N-terminal domain-containing protein n=1 Tax=unclassified Kitasatospora TaxID=2633591 RepID=UPI00247464CA|nr:Clp protease N-terminal domain-containing protein [Kitasatospora sp. MAP12-44]MDH6109809.1 ATP-dependent Clp protease ATP-binding subunit ClpA [Kitasatospora sp. MAP12-44]
MPKINVYLPDDLAEAVKETGVPVSVVCQRALEQAVRRVAAMRQALLADAGNGLGAAALERFTDRARSVLKRAAERAAAERANAEGAGTGPIATEHLLDGILAEEGNLALLVLRAMEIDPAQLARELRALPARAPGAVAGAGRFSAPAAAALELAVTEAVSLGHNYVGCEHLLLGLAAEPDGAAGELLRGLGCEVRAVRRAVTAALAGFALHATHTTQPPQAAAAPAAGPVAGPAALAEAVQRAVQPLLERIERLEARLD